MEKKLSVDLLTVMLKREISTDTILKISLIIDQEKKTGGEAAASQKRKELQTMIEKCETEQEILECLKNVSGDNR